MMTGATILAHVALLVAFIAAGLGAGTSTILVLIAIFWLIGPTIWIITKIANYLEDRQ